MGDMAERGEGMTILPVTPPPTTARRLIPGYSTTI